MTQLHLTSLPYPEPFHELLHHATEQRAANNSVHGHIVIAECTQLLEDICSLADAYAAHAALHESLCARKILKDETSHAREAGDRSPNGTIVKEFGFRKCKGRLRCTVCEPRQFAQWR